MPTTVETIRAYFEAFFKKTIRNEDNLFESGILDSMGIVALISYLEEKLKITIEPEEITEENFASIAAIDKLITAKLL
jgi:acyl carrier protein